jgi:uncharacterized membrane protein YkvI
MIVWEVDDMWREEKQVFVSRNKRRKEIAFLILGTSVIGGSIAFTLLGAEMPLVAWVVCVLVAPNALTLIRSLQYREIRAELTSGRCDIYVDGTLLTWIDIAAMDRSRFGQGLRLRFSVTMPFSDRVKLSSRFLHFFGPCIHHVVLPILLFPSISDVASQAGGQKAKKDPVPTFYDALWFGLKWNMIFVVVGLLCFVLFKADRVILGFVALASFLLFFARDCLRFSRRARRGIVRPPKRPS